MQGFEFEDGKWKEIDVPPKPWGHVCCEHCQFANTVMFQSNPPQFGYILCTRPDGLKGQLRKKDYCSKGQIK